MTDVSRDSFTQVPNWLIRDSVLSGNELLVYVALLSRRNLKGLAWPSRVRLAQESRLSESTVRRTVPMLESRGLVKATMRPRGDGRNHSNLYTVAALPFALPKPGQPYSHLVRHTPDTASTDGEGVVVTPPGVHGDSPEGVVVDQEEHPLKEHQEEEHMRLKHAFERDRMYLLDAPEELATTKQVDYLKDLHIHHYNEQPTQAKEEQWQALTQEKASRTIDAYLNAVGRNGMYDGPEEGTPEYEALSDTGKEWADTGMVPWEQGMPTTGYVSPPATESPREDIWSSMFTSKQINW